MKLKLKYKTVGFWNELTCFVIGDLISYSNIDQSELKVEADHSNELPPPPTHPLKHPSQNCQRVFGFLRGSDLISKLL